MFLPLFTSLPLLSSRYTGFRFQNTMMCEELASRGTIVLSLGLLCLQSVLRWAFAVAAAPLYILCVT